MECWLAACWRTARLQAGRSCRRGQRLLRRLQVVELGAVRATGLTCGAEQVDLRADELQAQAVKDHLAAAAD